MRLEVGPTNCVACPLRGDTSVATCGACPLLRRLKQRHGATFVLCRGPQGTATHHSGWVASRALTGRY